VVIRRRPIIPPVPFVKKITSKRIATFDCETTKFLRGRVPKPFTCCFYDGDTYQRFWGDDCIDQFFDWLSEETQDYLIYVHNGSGFDFHMGMLDYLDGGTQPFIIDGKIVKASYFIIPVPLAAYKKDEIDYDLFEPEVRERHKAKILHYQDLDCLYLHDLVTGFHRLFGDRLTMAGAALPMLNSYHGFDTMTPEVDAMLRPFFFGGRNQNFRAGVIKPNGPKFKIYDRNSMYPTVMAQKKHPISSIPRTSQRIGPKTAFARVRARNYGALCYRHENGGLDFTVENGTFFASIHEIRAGLDTGTLIIDKVIEAIDFDQWGDFAEFVECHYDLRMEAAARGDEVNKLFFKLLLNGSYGKLAIDPADFEDTYYSADGLPPPRGDMRMTTGGDINDDGWHFKHVRGDAIFWTRPNARRHRQYRNVATAASITGAARADLLYAIQGATNPIYCDTDSVVCEDMSGVTFGEKELGAWKVEAEGDTFYCGGKKLYALTERAQLVKKASKGVRLTLDEIQAVASGETIEYHNPVPKFHLSGDEPTFVTRNIKATGKVLLEA
jgi:hypothetical protein